MIKRGKNQKKFVKKSEKSGKSLKNPTTPLSPKKSCV